MSDQLGKPIAVNGNMTGSDCDTRQLVRWLDDAIEEYDLQSERDKTLASVLTAIADTAKEFDAPFAARALRVAERANRAVDPSQRDIASMLARDVRRDLMCTFSRAEQPRMFCAPDANAARTRRTTAQRGRAFEYLGE